MTSSNANRAPLGAAIGCFVLWGVYPLMFQWVAAQGPSAVEMLAWRMVSAAPFAALLVVFTGKGREFLDLARRPKEMLALAFAGAVMATNWGVYIWAVSNHQTLSASLGYYINPLLNVSVAALVYRERLDRFGLIALGLAAAGVALQTAAVGAFPWVAMGLAVTFCVYGMVRKGVAVASQTGLLVECLTMLIPAGLFCAWLLAHGGGVFGVSPSATFGLVIIGGVTIGPLALYGYAVRRVSFTAMAFLQFIAPTMIFVIGAAQGEPLDAMRLVSFGFIWAGVAVFAFGAARKPRAP